MLLLIVTAIVGGIVGLGSHIVCARFFPLYSGDVLFEVRTGLNEAADVGATDFNNQDEVDRNASSETVLLTSREILEVAVKDRDVQQTNWFRNNFTSPTGVRLVDEAVDELEEDVKSRLVRGTNIFALRWSTPIDRDVPVVLNAISDAYITRRKQQADESYNGNIRVFKGELSTTERQLQDLTQQIERFIRQEGITTLDDPRSTQLAQKLQEIIERIQEAQGQLSMAQSAYTLTQAKLEGDVRPTEDDRRDAEFHPAVRPHELAVLEVKTLIRELKQIYRDPNHFLIRRTEGRLRALELEYEDKVQQIMLDNLRASLKEYADAVGSFSDMLEDLEREYQDDSVLLKELAADMATYQAMEAQRSHLELTRDELEATIREVRLLKAREDARRVQVFQVALTPREKSFPKIEIMVPLVAIAMLALVTGLIFLREFTDQRVKSVSDLAGIAGAHVLGIIPDLEDDPCRAEEAELVVQRCPISVLAESYRQVWTNLDRGLTRGNLLHRTGEGGPAVRDFAGNAVRGRAGTGLSRGDGIDDPLIIIDAEEFQPVTPLVDHRRYRTVLVVGALPGSGSTTVITNLATTAVAAGRRVLVVDANFHRPRLGVAFNLPADTPGLGEILAGVAEADEVVKTVDGIDILPAGRPEYRSSERLTTGHAEERLADLRERYDLILVDAPPAMVAGDALALACKVDAAVLVVRAGIEHRGLVRRIVRQLDETTCELIGIVLNRPRGTAGGYFKKNFAAMAAYAGTPKS